MLPVQGPPGSGKTYTGARMILALLQAGKKVGVTATSHKVITNLLEEVCRAAGEAGRKIRGIQKAKEEQWCGMTEIVASDSNDQVLEALQSRRCASRGGHRLALEPAEEMMGVGGRALH